MNMKDGISIVAGRIFSNTPRDEGIHHGVRFNHFGCGKQLMVLYLLLRYNMCRLQQLDLVTPFQLYFNPILILKQGQVHRLITTFLFFGTFGFNFFFNMIFTYRYCRMLEEGSFRDRTADFVMMFLFGGFSMVVSLLRSVNFKNLIVKQICICISNPRHTFSLTQIVVLCFLRQPVVFGSSLYYNDCVHMGPEKPTHKDELFWSS